MPKIGIQLYTLRDYIKTYEDTEKTFEFVKSLGTNVIQISGIGPIEPEKVAFLVDKYGMDAPAKKFQESFALAGFPLWHANMQARKNYHDSIFAPLSGSPEFNIHADDIDFQIER